MSVKPLPLLLVTGFLGSGKTTLINRWLQLRQGPKLGVLVNEFGDVGIDKATMGPGDIVEIGGGCVCCATGEELWESALQLRERAGVERVVVETSGIAEPTVLLQQYDALPKQTKEEIDLRAILCVVDAAHIGRFLQKRKETQAQLQCADRLLLTKIDLVSAQELAEVHAMLDRNKASTSRAAVPIHASPADVLQSQEWAFARSLNPKFVPSASVHNKGQLQVVAWSTSQRIIQGALHALLHQIQPDVLRVKGLIRLAKGDSFDYAVVHVAGTHLQWLPCPSPPQDGVSSLIVIGENLDEGVLRLQLQACCVG